jgi:hypothetical protein
MSTSVELLPPLKADIQPLAPIPTMARQCEKAIRQLALRGADEVMLLVDRENRSECASLFARALGDELRRRACGAAVTVVVKNRTFENWLLADLDALTVQRRRFRVSRTTRSMIEPDKADNVDALLLIGRCVQGDYDKVADAKRIMSHADALRIAQHSRSFRRFLRCARARPYLSQSARPA